MHKLLKTFSVFFIFIFATSSISAEENIQTPEFINADEFISIYGTDKLIDDTYKYYTEKNLYTQ